MMKRQQALQSLKELTKQRCYKVIGEEVSPGELWLIQRVNRLSFGPLTRKKQRELQSLLKIARGLALNERPLVRTLIRLGKFPALYSLPEALKS